MTYQDKVVIVTGASNGIGASVAKAYHEQGARVVSLDIQPSHNDWQHITVDLSDEQQVINAFQAVTQQYGAIHILINNGAITTSSRSILEVSTSEFAKVIDVNLNGAFTCSREFVRANQGESFGRIINISSTRWQQNEFGWDAYGASKGGLVSLTHSLVNSLSHTPITINTISPGWIETSDYDALRKEDHAQHPSGRVGKPQDIVNACLFLTHSDNDFINGANISIDGGMTKRMIYQD
ncbi:SDR family oxidoreductase [Vibrio aquaticus]|uniref:SDR family oxidoreductase n=1 Tax=Vibrio aquaticus TaxID=2496559 RepID=A0A432D1F9_9VIBR|nr:SDR family oxidoreductase [Vibrio aquaticus]RTZ17762.1 SDR family oxidoreductase [Vibrio aquaticus]